jgi:hypothetical protein
MSTTTQQPTASIHQQRPGKKAQEAIVMMLQERLMQEGD